MRKLERAMGYKSAGISNFALEQELESSKIIYEHQVKQKERKKISS
jgi:hypothetical protein